MSPAAFFRITSACDISRGSLLSEAFASRSRVEATARQHYRGTPGEDEWPYYSQTNWAP